MRTCSVDGCSRKHYARGFCASHYTKWRLEHPTPRNSRAQTVCSVEGCSRSADAKGMCHMHYRRWQKTGNAGPAAPLNAAPDNPRCCSVEECTLPHYCKGYCRSHYAHWRNHGHPTEKPERVLAACSAAGCPNRAWSQGMCHAHYYAWKRTGDPGDLGAVPEAKPAQMCSVEGCTNFANSSRRDLCNGHRHRLTRYGHVLGGKRPVRPQQSVPKVCRVEGCGNRAIARGLCDSHYSYDRKYGDPERITTMPAIGTGRPPERPGVSITVRRACTVAGCAKEIWNVRTGLCSLHYGRLRQYGDPEATVRHRGISALGCSVPGCGHSHYGAGFCRRHWSSLVGNKYRRDAEKLAAGNATLDQVVARVAYYGWACWICGAPFSEIDHVKPIARGGSNWPSNLRPICLPCNRKKSAKWTSAAETQAQALLRRHPLS